MTWRPEEPKVAIMSDYRGKWALVTGASAGIGAVFARSLAARGAHVAIVARRMDRLQTLADELKKSGVDALPIACDLSQPDAPENIFAATKSAGADISILVNNAGFGLPGHYLESEWRAHRGFLELMVVSYAHLVRLYLPAMQAARWGRIINVASLAGLVPGSAGHTMYGASKAFLVSFSQSLAAENRDRGILCSALCPGFTLSEFHDVNGTRELINQLPSYMIMKPEPVVDGAFDAVERGLAVYVPGAWNKFAAALSQLLPRTMAEQMVARNASRFRRQAAV
jgi:hypothetical protein